MWEVRPSGSGSEVYQGGALVSDVRLYKHWLRVSSALHREVGRQDKEHPVSLKSTRPLPHTTPISNIEPGRTNLTKQIPELATLANPTDHNAT